MFTPIKGLIYNFRVTQSLRALDSMTSCNFIHMTTHFSGSLLPGSLGYAEATKNLEQVEK